MSLKVTSLTTKDNCLYMNNERHILISSSAFAELRKDLINNIGLERMKGFLLRYGWELGQKDAQKIKNESNLNIREMVFLGPMLHTKKGHTYVDGVQVEIDEKNGNVFKQMSGTWHYSYEAEEHIKLFGVADYEVCFTLVGYASGYISKLFDELIIFKETTCKGKGDDVCRWIGKPVAAWGEQAADFLNYYKERPIILELEETYDKLLHERNNLAKTAEVQKRLTEEIIKGNDLHTISEVVEDILDVPLLIEDQYLRTIAYSTSLTVDKEEIKTCFKQYVEDNYPKSKSCLNEITRTMNNTKLFTLKNHKRLMTPFYLQGKIYGYCSLILDKEDKCSEVLETIIERISSVCSLYLLNEKAKFETLERMKGKFLEELINDDYTDKTEIIQRGNYLQLNLENPYYIAVIHYTFFSESISDEFDFHQNIMEEVTDFCQKEKINTLIGQRTNVNSIDLLISIEEENDRSIDDIIQRIMTHLKKTYVRSKFSAGISERSEDIAGAADLFQQAKAAVRLAKFQENITSFESIGIVGSLINENNIDTVLKSAENELKPLYQHNKVTCEETLKTLYYFLINGGNLEQTALDLSLSVSGLRYRIRRIEDKLKKDLRDSVENYQLLLSLQSLILTGRLEWV